MSSTSSAAGIMVSAGSAPTAAAKHQANEGVTVADNNTATETETITNNPIDRIKTNTQRIRGLIATSNEASLYSELASAVAYAINQDATQVNAALMASVKLREEETEKKGAISAIIKTMAGGNWNTKLTAGQKADIRAEPLVYAVAIIDKITSNVTKHVKHSDSLINNSLTTLLKRLRSIVSET